MKKITLTFITIMLCCIVLNAADGEFKFQNMYYISTSDSTAKLSRGYLVGDIVIPDTVTKGGNKYAVTEIKSGAFSDYCHCDPRITTVTIPATMKIIRTQAFSGQTGITDLYFLGGNITFESSVFSLSNFITRKVHINNFEEWCNNKYPQKCDDGRVYSANPLYGAYLYINGEEVQNVHLSHNVTTISDNAFEGMLNSISITCDTGLISIGNYAFMGSKIQNIELPSSLKEIGKCAFQNCPIQNLTIPENVESIGSYAFENNKQFIKIVWKAKSLHCQNNMPGYAIFSLTSGQLDTLIIDAGVVSLPEYMFYSTIYAVKPIIISRNKNVPHIYNRTFYAVNKNSVVYVPYGTRGSYRSAWGFNNVYEMDPDEEDELRILQQKLKELIVTARAYYESHLDLSTTEYMQALLLCIESSQAILDSSDMSRDQLNLAIETLNIALEQAKKGATSLDFEDCIDGENLIKTVLFRGQIYILRGDKTYTVQGQEVR